MDFLRLQIKEWPRKAKILNGIRNLKWVLLRIRNIVLHRRDFRSTLFCLVTFPKNISGNILVCNSLETWLGVSNVKLVSSKTLTAFVTLYQINWGFYDIFKCLLKKNTILKLMMVDPRWRFFGNVRRHSGMILSHNWHWLLLHFTHHYKFHRYSVNTFEDTQGGGGLSPLPPSGLRTPKKTGYIFNRVAFALYWGFKWYGCWPWRIKFDVVLSLFCSSQF